MGALKCTFVFLSLSLLSYIPSILCSNTTEIPNQAKAKWIVTEWHHNDECTALEYAHFQVLGECYYDHEYLISRKYLEGDTGVVERWDCTDTQCGNCKSTEKIPITEERVCETVSYDSESSENFDYPYANYKTNTYTTSVFPQNFEFPNGTIEKTFTVQFDQVNCSGKVTAVDVEPLWCFEGCTAPNQVFCDLPAFLRTSHPLSGSAIAVIVIAILLVVGLMISGGIFYYVRKAKDQPIQYSKELQQSE